jgi:C1A family cysteine protease
MATTRFTQALGAVVEVTATETRVFDEVTIQSPEDLLSLLWNFPSLAQRGMVNAAKLSGFAAPQTPSFIAMMSNEGLLADQPRTFALGAAAPEESTVNIGTAQEDILRTPPATTLDVPGTIDKRSGMSWPVRDQGQRGTCVAHAVTALREHLAFRETGQLPDLSEQFLFWATKTRTADPMPNADGTWIRYAVEALKNDGACQESDWPYNGTPMFGNVTQSSPGVPTPTAISNAKSFQHTAATYASAVPGNGATRVLQELRSCRPVAVSLPVFADPLRPNGHNWNSPVGVLYGRVLDPPPTSVVVGGHAVCITGFVRDPEEPSGGYFVIRNSWDRSWGKNLPAAGYHGPEIGYGQVSATYLNQYLWELARL